ncbi:sulfite exporter TauE/SafE family protein, partial [Glaesserella parasuis]|uniref:urease accessory protein UreH domain-containing protein n=1 Tax=Glaesserella parasuis TaxID=738 RepID=UPI003B797578
MNAVDFTLMFALGLAGSLHCVQMCGPLVLSLDLQGHPSFVGHVRYHAGRVITYTILGALAGWLGTGVQVLLAIDGIANGAAIAA